MVLIILQLNLSKAKKYENIFLKSVLIFLLAILMSSFPNTKEVSLLQKQNNQI